MTIPRRVVAHGLALGLFVAALLFWAPAVSADGTTPCDPATACFEGALSPATLVGDFYLDGQLAAAGVNSARLTGAPSAAHLLEIKNIREPNAAGMGDTFVYPDQSRPNLMAGGGVVFYAPFWPIRNYVKGVLNYTCNPWGRQATDTVACRPTVDSAAMPDVAPGATASYNLTPGTHAVHTDLVGNQADHWSPVTRDDSVTIYAGGSTLQSTPLLASFIQKGTLKLGLFPNTLQADWTVDGAPVAARAGSVDVFVAAGAHTVEAKAITEAGAAGFGDLYVYADQSRANVYAPAAQIRYVIFGPARTYIKGALNYVCNPWGQGPSESVACRPTVDGVTMPDVGAGAVSVYNLPGGAHIIHTDLVGPQATDWSPLTRDDKVTVFAGGNFLQWVRLSAAFIHKGLLKISLLPAGLTADIFVDNAPAAAQAASANVYVAAGAHTVEARTVTDPAANGQYTYGNVSQASWAYAGGTSLVYLFPPKTWLVGFLNVICQIPGKSAADDAACAVSENGTALATVAAGQQGVLRLTPGAHTLTFSASGAQAAKFDGPTTATLTIFGGQTAYTAAYFNLRPAPPAPSAAKPGFNHLGTPKVVLADYMMWFGPDAFDGTKTWDVPASGPYNSDDMGTIRRQLAEAQQACLDGFAAHWYGPSDARTTNNFNQLLAASAGTNLRHALVLQANILPGASEQSIIDAINYAIHTWVQSPNYMRVGGRPLLIFTDMPRPWGDDASALAGWTRIRAATDPNHTLVWMAEGLHATYNPLFDGLYVYRIDHRDYPQSWLKQFRWANELRAVEQQGNLPIGGLYFADTIAAGFDDTRSVNAPADFRSGAPHFARDRRNGGYFADTFAATASTGGDFLFVKSFNEWIEGTEIEPGRTYGDLYLNLTCQYANAYRSR
jgi:hypothetical protein